MNRNLKSSLLATLILGLTTMANAQGGPAPAPPAGGGAPPPALVTLTDPITFARALDLPPGSILKAFTPSEDMVVPTDTVVEGVTATADQTLTAGEEYDEIKLPATLAGPVTGPAGSRYGKNSLVPSIILPPPPVYRIGGVGYGAGDAPAAKFLTRELARRDRRTEATVGSAVGAVKSELEAKVAALQGELTAAKADITRHAGVLDNHAGILNTHGARLDGIDGKLAANDELIRRLQSTAVAEYHTYRCDGVAYPVVIVSGIRKFRYRDGLLYPCQGN